MSLPIARARRKNVPSIQRSPYCEHVVPLAHGVLEAQGGDVAGLLELADLPLVLDQAHLGDHPGEVVVAGLVGGHELVDGRRTRHGARGSCRRRRARRAGRRCAAPAGRATDSISCSDGRRPAHSSPYWRSRKNSSVSRDERGPRVEHRVAALDDEHRVAGLVAGEVGVGGVGAEAVVGVVGAHLVATGGQHQPLAGEHLGEAGATPRRRTRRRADGEGRARGRPSPGA